MIPRRVDIELAAFRRLRLALIAAGVPHASADDLARSRVDRARSMVRTAAADATRRAGHGEAVDAPAIVRTAQRTAMRFVHPAVAVPAVLSGEYAA